MVDKAVLTWHPRSGGWVRRGHYAYVPNLMVDQMFDDLTVADPMLLADLKKAVGNPAAGNATMTPLQLRADDGSGHGKTITWTSQPNTKSGGFTYYPQLPTPVDKAKVSYWVRFRGSAGNQWIYSKGGKLPGLGGCIAPLNKPPTGGNPSVYGWSSRTMWLGDSVGGARANNDHALAYLYDPTQVAPNYGQNRLAYLNGSPVGFGGSGGRADGGWHHIEQVHHMNTVVTDGDPNPPADGLHEFYFDGQLVYQNTTQVYRLYTAARITNLCFDMFRGGPDDTWGAPEMGYIDIDSLQVMVL